MKSSGIPNRVNRCLAFMTALIVAGIAASCGGGYGSSSGGGHGLTASITNSVASVQAGATYTFTATTPSSYGYTAGIAWSLSPATGAGTLSGAMNSGYSSSVVYQAPATPPSPNSVSIIATPSDTRVGPAKDTFTITASAMSMLKGPLAVELSGANSAGETLAAVGSLVADGAGNITGGSIDLNRNGAPTVHVAGATGTYTLDSTMHGGISLGAVPGSDRVLAFSFVLAADQQSALIAGFDSDGARLSGLLLRQDPASFSLAKISSDFAFKLESDSPDRVATVGKFTLGNNQMLSGIADRSKPGVDPIFDAARIAGHLTAPPDANGRGTFTLVTPAEHSSIVFYVASGQLLFLLEGDSSPTARARQVGVAERQMLPFSAATANASARIRGSGFDSHPSSLGAVFVRGSLAIRNLSQATLSWDAGGAAGRVSIDSLRSDLVTFDPSTGRGTIQIANGAANNFADAIAFYLASPGSGFFVDKTPGRFNRAIAGDFEPTAAK
jgi:hypothetical protein